MRQNIGLFKKNVYRCKKFKDIGIKDTVIYFVFQRVFRINSHVPWPVHWSSLVVAPEKIKRKYDTVHLGYMPGCYIQAINGIEVGGNLRVGPGVKIISADHSSDDYDIHIKTNPIKIGDNCWLAANCVILPGVELGDHTIVAAGAVVSKSFQGGNCILGGIPAKIIKNLDRYTGAIKRNG